MNYKPSWPWRTTVLIKVFRVFRVFSAFFVFSKFSIFCKINESLTHVSLAFVHESID